MLPMFLRNADFFRVRPQDADTAKEKSHRIACTGAAHCSVHLCFALIHNLNP